MKKYQHSIQEKLKKINPKVLKVAKNGSLNDV